MNVPMQRLGDVTQIMVGATPAAPSQPARARYVRLGDISDDGKIHATTEGPAPTRGLDSRLRPGDVVIRARGMPIAAVVGDGFDGAFPSNDVIVIRSEGATDAIYLAAILNLPASRKSLQAETQGSVMPRLSVSTLSNLAVPLPPLPVQRQLAELAEGARAEREALIKMQELRWQLSQELLRQAAGKAHGEGGSPGRGSRPVARSEGSSGHSSRRARSQ
jgi:hypothetical protein